MTTRSIDILTYKSQTSLDASKAVAIRDTTNSNRVSFTNLMLGDYDLFYLSTSATAYSVVFFPENNNPTSNTRNICTVTPVPLLTITSATLLQPVDIAGTFAYMDNIDVIDVVRANTSGNILSLNVSYEALGLPAGTVSAISGFVTPYAQTGTLEIQYTVGTETETSIFKIGQRAYISTSGIMSKSQRQTTFPSTTIGTGLTNIYFTPISVNPTGFTFGNTLEIPISNFTQGPQYLLKILGVPSGSIKLGDDISSLLDINDATFSGGVQTFDGVNNDNVYSQNQGVLAELQQYTTLTFGKRDRYYPLQIESISLADVSVTSLVNNFIVLPYCTTLESDLGQVRSMYLFFTLDFSGQYPVRPSVPPNLTFPYQASNVVSRGSGLFSVIPRLDPAFLSEYPDYFVFNTIGAVTRTGIVGGEFIASSLSSLPTDAVNAAGYLNRSYEYTYFSPTIRGQSGSFYVVPFSVRVNRHNGVPYRFISLANNFITMTYSNANEAFVQVKYPTVAAYPLYMNISFKDVDLYPAAVPVGYELSQYNVFFNDSPAGAMTSTQVGANKVYSFTLYGVTDSTVYDSFKLQPVYSSPGQPSILTQTMFISDKFRTDTGLIIPNSSF